MLAENCIYWFLVYEWKRLVQEGKLGGILHADGLKAKRLVWNVPCACRRLRKG